MSTPDVLKANAQVAAALLLQKPQHPQAGPTAKQPEVQPSTALRDKLKLHELRAKLKLQEAAATQKVCELQPHPPIEALPLWEAFTKHLLRQPEAQFPAVRKIIRSMRQLRERHMARLRPYQSLCIACGVLKLRRDLDESRCEACDTSAPPEGFVRMCNTGVPISAFRQMGLMGWWCSVDDASFAKTLRRISCYSQAYLDELEDDAQSDSRAEAVNNAAFGLMREDEEYEEEEIELELEIEEDLGELDDLLLKLQSQCGFFAAVVRRQGVALRKQISEERELVLPDVWISEDLYNRVAEQVCAAQIAREFDGYD